MSWYHCGVLVVVVLLSSGYGYPEEYASLPADETYMTSMFKLVHTHQNDILQRVASLISHLRPDVDIDDVIANIVSVSRADTVLCEGCKVEIEVVNTLIALGLTYADIRTSSIEYCIQTEEENGYWNAADMCPGIADRYYPHVFNILQHNFTSEYVCQKLNECERTETYLTSHQNKQKQPHQPPPKKQPPVRRNLPHDLDNAYKLIIMSDIHVEMEYLEGSSTDCGFPVCCRGDAEGQGEAGHWGDYHCNVPPRTTELMLDKAATLNPDLVVYTGDSPPHIKWLETLTSQIAVTEYVTSAFEQHMPGVIVFPCIGNHEIYPADMYHTKLDDIEIWNAAFTRNWQRVSGFDTEQVDTIRSGGYYSQLIQPGLRILTFNSNYGYIYNWYNLLNEFEDEYLDMITFMEQTLADARENSEKVILMSHQPHGDQSHILEDADILNPLIRSYSDVIVIHPIGHLHRDDFKLFLDPSTGEALNVQVMNQAMQTWSFVNPGFRVVYLDPVTFTPLDYEQYTMNLTAEQSETPPSIDILYTASTEYDMPDLTPASYADLWTRFEDDDELFQRFYSNMNSHSVEVEPCVGECKIQRLCWMRCDHYVDYLNCINQ